MSKYRDLSPGDVFPAYWTDAIQEFTGSATSNLRLTTPSASTVRVAAGTGNDQVAIALDGLYRYRSSNADVTISGASGTYNLYAAASDNSISGVTDSTDYNWYLFFGTTAPTGTISGAGTIYATRKIGEVDWDSSTSSITAVRQLVGAGDSTAPANPTASAATVTPLVVRGAASQSANLISAGSSSSATDRLVLNSDGRLALPVTGSTGGVVIGGDANLYRSAASTLRTDNNLIAGATITGNALVSTTSVTAASLTTSGAITAGTTFSAASASVTNGVSAATVTTTGNATIGGGANSVTASISQNSKTALTLSGASAGLTIGGDSNLYRSAADTLKTDDSFVVAGDVTVQGNLFTQGGSGSSQSVLSLSGSGKTTLAFSSTTVNTGLTIGSDTNLFRSAANTLATDDNFTAALTITGNALVSTTSVSAASLSTTAGATVGTTLSANAVSSATVTTTGNVTVGATMAAVAASASQNNKTALVLSGASAGLTIGGDTTLYRANTSTLQTDGSFIVSGNATIGGSTSTIGFYGATPAARSTGWSVTNVTTDKVFDADATTVNELADVLGTLINTLKTAGLIA